MLQGLCVALLLCASAAPVDAVDDASPQASQDALVLEAPPADATATEGVAGAAPPAEPVDTPVSAPVPEPANAVPVQPTWSQFQSGLASYYHARFDGRRTASGQRYRHTELTAAHRTLPFGTQVLVTNRDNGKQVLVTINDRGPFVKKRVIDLSGAAAEILGMKHKGLVQVEIARRTD